MTDKEVFEAAINKFGIDHQVDKAIEEMAELTKALIKERRENNMYSDEILDEIVDVSIMIEQLKMIHFILPEDYENYEKRKAYKINRLKSKL